MGAYIASQIFDGDLKTTSNLKKPQKISLLLECIDLDEIVELMERKFGPV